MSGDKDKGVNPVILDSVEKTTEYVFGTPKDFGGYTGDAPTQAYNAGSAIGYEKVAQATAYEIQDAADFQRNMLAINGAAQGKALALMFEDVGGLPATSDKLLGHAMIYLLTIAGNFANAATTEYIGKCASKTLSDYAKATGSGPASP